MSDWSYSVSNIQETCFKDYILKKHGGKTDNLSIRRHVNEIENRITFKVKTGYYLELLTPETIN